MRQRLLAQYIGDGERTSFPVPSYDASGYKLVVQVNGEYADKFSESGGVLRFTTAPSARYIIDLLLEEVGAPDNLTASAIASALGTALGANGELIANIVPRTGTLAALSPPNSPAGTAGEIAVATDAQAVVVLSGTAGDAQVLAPWGGYQVKSFVIGAEGYSVDDLTWPTDVGRLILHWPIDPVQMPSGPVTLTAGHEIGQSCEVYSRASGNTSFTVPVHGGSVLLNPGELIRLQWQYTNPVGPADPAWVLVDRQIIDPLNLFGIALPYEAAVRDGTALLMDTSVGTIAVGGGLYFVASPRHYAVGTRNEKVPSYRSTASIKAATTSTAASELTLNGEVGNALVNRLFVAPMGWQSMYRIEADVFARAGAANNWFGRRWALVRVSSAGGITIVATGTDGTDQANGVTAPTALAFSSPTARALTLSVTPANTTATNWAAHITVTAVEV